MHVSTSGIKEVFVDKDNSVFSAPALCFCSRKKPGKHITETLADSVSNVKLCGGGVKYCLSSTCTVLYMCYSVSSLQYIALYYIHVVIVTWCFCFLQLTMYIIVLQWSQYETVYIHLVYENVYLSRHKNSHHNDANAVHYFARI